MHSLQLASGLLLALAAASTALAAQSPVPQPRKGDTAAATYGTVVYPAPFYEAFVPQNALEMLERTPGFTLDAPDGDELLRGFGSNAGNVLVDGARPTVKSGGVAAYLGRIGATRVERIELLRGALLAEAQGHALIANLVLRREQQASGQVAIELRRAPGDGITPRIDASHAIDGSSWDVAGGLVGFYERNPKNGSLVGHDAAGARLFEARAALREREEAGTLSFTASRALGGGEFALNARAGGSKLTFSHRSTPQDAPRDADEILGAERSRDAELGIDWSLPLAGKWDVKFVSLARRDSGRYLESEPGDDSAMRQHTGNRELVGRVTLHDAGGQRLRPEFSAELAWNRADSEFDFTRQGQPVELPGADTRVTELRGEVGANLAATLDASKRLESSLHYERSRIAVRSMERRQRWLDFWKPAMAAVWDASDAIQLRLGWRRAVDQLDFSGFAASGDLIDDRPLAGNAELSPVVTQGWSLRTDHRFGERGAVALTLSREQVRGALSYVPLESGNQALLNSTTVSTWNLDLAATLPLDAWVRGAQLTAEGSLVRARRNDPVTGVRRADIRNGQEGSVAFRHDIGAWRSAYGVTVESSSVERTWYLDEVDSWNFRPYVSAFVETSAWLGVKSTLTLWGLTGEYERQTRRFYQPDRNGAFAGSERRIHEVGTYVTLVVSRQF